MTGITVENLNQQPKGYLLSPQLEAEIAKLLGDHKMTVFRGFTQNYDDFTVHYMDWIKDKPDVLYLRAGKGDVDDKGRPKPNFLTWLDLLKETFKPLKKYMDEETEKHNTQQKLKEEEQKAKNRKNLT